MSDKPRQLSFYIDEDIYIKFGKYIEETYGIKPRGKDSITRDIRSNLIDMVMHGVVDDFIIDPRQVINHYVNEVRGCK